MNKIIYQLTVEDVQTVALQELGEELPIEEIKDMEELVAKRIDWYDAIAYAIAELKLNKKAAND